MNKIFAVMMVAMSLTASADDLVLDRWRPRPVIPVWIRPERAKQNATFVLAKDFACEKKVAKAKICAGAAGIGVWRINGQRIGDDYYEPVVSYYEKRLFFRDYDITKNLKEKNRIEVEVGGGWFDQNLAWACERWNNQSCSYGSPAVLAYLDIEYVDGTKESILTDTTWQAGEGRSIWNSIYGGEIIDDRGRFDKNGEPLDTPTNGKVVVAKDIVGTFQYCIIPPCRVLKQYAAKVSCALGQKGDVWIYDFGENIAGSVKFKLPPLVPGSRLKVRLAETLTKEGFLDPRSEGAAAMHHAPEYIYIAPEVPRATEFIPEFSYTSFRYAEVSGYEPYPDIAKNWGAQPPSDLLTGVMIATDVMRRLEVGKSKDGVEVEGGISSRSIDLSKFDNADAEIIRRFIKVADHTIRCNLHGVPEDCPGREKGGWLGDANVVCPYALKIWHLDDIYEKYMQDIADATEIFGTIPCQVPTHRAFSWGPAPALWRAAAIGIPYQLYVQRGNSAAVKKYWWVIEKCLEMFAKDAEKDGLVRWGYGDWIPPTGNEYKMPVQHSSNLCWIECLEQADYLAKQIGIETKCDYAKEAQRVREQFKKEFFDEKNGTFGYDGTDAIAFNLGIADTMPALLKRLEERDYMMTTGIYGTPHLVRALLKTNHRDVMMKVLFNEKHASYRTMLDQGFTTCPENIAETHRVSRTDRGQASLSHPMHCGWLAELIRK